MNFNTVKVMENSFDIIGGSERCETEIRIANAIASQEVCNIEEVCAKFDITREQAILILDSRSFLKLLNKLKRCRTNIALARGVNVLIEILENGNANERLAAFDLIERLVNE
jgi:hypothetical protein